MLRNQLDHRKWKIRYRTLSVYHVAWEIALGLWSKGRTWPEFILDLVMLLVHSVGCYMAVSLYLTVCWTEGRRGTSREAGRTCKEPRNCRYSLFSATRQLALLSNGWHSSNNDYSIQLNSLSRAFQVVLIQDYTTMGMCNATDDPNRGMWVAWSRTAWPLPPGQLLSPDNASVERQSLWHLLCLSSNVGSATYQFCDLGQVSLKGPCDLGQVSLKGPWTL